MWRNRRDAAMSGSEGAKPRGARHEREDRRANARPVRDGRLGARPLRCRYRAVLAPRPVFAAGPVFPGFPTSTSHATVHLDLLPVDAFGPQPEARSSSRPRPLHAAAQRISSTRASRREAILPPRACRDVGARPVRATLAWGLVRGVAPSLAAFLPSLLTLFLFAGAGCATLGAGADDPDGGTSDDGGRRDTGKDRGPVDPCQGVTNPALRICADEGTVATCLKGHVAPLQSCAAGASCRGGRCLSASCAEAEDQQSSVGCLFYTAHADAVAADRAAGRKTVLVVGNARETDDAHVEVSTKVMSSEAATGEPTWQVLATATVPAGGAAQLVVDSPAAHALGVLPGAGLRIVSDEGVSLFQLQDDDGDNRAVTARGTTLLPAHALGAFYRAMAFPQATDGRVAALDPESGGAAMLVVVATRDRTTVTVTPPVGEPLTDGEPKAEAFSVTLDEGDVLQAATAAPGADLSATVVTANAPVAVYAGNLATDYASTAVMDATRAIFADGLYEAMWPVSSWASTWLVTRIPPSADSGCDSFFGSGSTSPLALVVMTAEQSATVSIANQTADLVSPVFMAANTARTFFLPPQTGSTGMDLVEVSAGAGERIWVAQALDCAPSLVPAVPVEGVFSRYVLGFPLGFRPGVAVFHDAAAQIFLDGRPAVARTTAAFPRSPIKKASHVAVTFFDEAELGNCRAGDTLGCTHLLSGEFFGVSWRGEEATTSYGTTAPIFTCQGPGSIESCF